MVVLEYGWVFVGNINVLEMLVLFNINLCFNSLWWLIFLVILIVFFVLFLVLVELLYLYVKEIVLLVIILFIMFFVLDIMVVLEGNFLKIL